MHAYSARLPLVELNHLAPAFGDSTETSLQAGAVSYTHLRAHETVLALVCRLLLEKQQQYSISDLISSMRHITLNM